MFRPTPMKKFYLTIQTEKEDETVEALGKGGLAQLICEYAIRTPPKTDDLKIFESYRRLLEKIKTLPPLEPSKKEKKSFKRIIGDLFKKQGRTKKVTEKELNHEDIGSYFAETESKIDKAARLREIDEEISELKKFLVLEKNGIAVGTLGNYEHVFVKAGFLNKDQVMKFPEYVRGINIEYNFKPFSDASELVVIAGSVDKRTEVEDILTHLNFDELRPPEAVKGRGIEEQVEEKEKEAEALRTVLLETVEEFGRMSAAFEPSMRVITKKDQARNCISRTGSFSVIRGWVPKGKLDDFRNLVKQVAGENFVLDVEDPSANEKPPIMTKSYGFMKYFDPIIQIRGMPDYNEINPTPIIIILFLAMFGMMFGDIGEGVVFIILGYIFTKTKSNMLQKIGGLLALCGISATVFGFMYGAVFLAEVVHPILFRPLTDIMLTIKIAFIFGVVQITLGMVINIINKTIQRDKADVLGGSHGIAGLVFYLGFISLVFLSGLSIGKIGQYPLVLAVTFGALAVVVATPTLKAIRSKHRLSSGAMESGIALFEVPITFLANSVSYLRIAALALIHGAFALLASQLTGGGGILVIPIYLMLNILVIGLEGMVVMVQTLRLIYYEFFTKFYSGTGTPYRPFKI